MRWTIVLLGALSLGMGRTEATAPGWPLKQIFAKDAAVIQLSNEALAEVCTPDECTRIVLGGKDGVAVVHDFTFLYFWLVRGFDLTQYRDKQGKPYVDAVLARRQGACTGADREAVGRCALVALAARYRFTGLVNRMDNGWRKNFPLDIPGSLREAGVAP